LNITRAWEVNTNSISTPLLKVSGIPILNIWNASRTANAACHVGTGVDCVHYCEPGVVSYFNDALLSYLWHVSKPVDDASMSSPSNAKKFPKKITKHTLLKPSLTSTHKRLRANTKAQSHCLNGDRRGVIRSRICS